MELIRHTIEFIKKKPYGKKILSKVKDEVQLVVDVTQEYVPFDKRSIIEKNTRNVVRHAYYREYRSLQRLCLLILQQQKHQIGSGARQIYGILFDGAWLWEEYVNQLISDKFYHPRNKSGEGAQRLFAGGVGLIYPDFIGREQSPRLIADAKYKPTDNIGGKDYLQLLAYMLRFDVKTGYYLYPDSQSTGDKKLMLNEGVKFENNVKARDDICVIKHGLRIPDNAINYDDFVVAMENGLASADHFEVKARLVLKLSTLVEWVRIVKEEHGEEEEYERKIAIQVETALLNVIRLHGNEKIDDIIEKVSFDKLIVKEAKKRLITDGVIEYSRKKKKWIILSEEENGQTDS